MKQKHRKHPKLARPNVGIFHREEWAILGTTCDDIKDLAAYIMDKALMPIAYLDHTHNPAQNPNLYLCEDGKIIESNTGGKLDNYSLYDALQSYAILLVNGNHREARRQIVVIDEKKRDSLKRRIDQCTQVDLVIHKSGDPEDFKFLEDKLRTRETQPKRCKWDEKDEVFRILNEEYRANLPTIKALILAGGESLRMGEDKSRIAYHEDAQYLHLAKMCQSIGVEPYISLKDQTTGPDGYPVISDRIKGLGPFGAICSAFMSDPDSAWLVIACDLPFLEKEDLLRLIESRDPSAYATCYQHPAKEFPEPLITIFEPRSYGRFLHFLSKGHSCPRKVLINSFHKSIAPRDPNALMNVNTPEEKAEAMKSIDN